MKCYHSPTQLQCNNSTAVALGTFDGLHLAHQRVIQQAVVSPYPSVVFAIEKPREDGKALLQPTQKHRLLEAMGVDHCVQIPLETIANLSPEEFFQTYLVETLQAKEVVCGFNFRFGNNAKGDVCLLQQLCNQAGIALQVVDSVTLEGQPVSSTRVRTALSQGDLPLASKLLGRYFGFTAPVVMGRQLGRVLGFPTINQEIPPELFPLKTGVYAVLAKVEEETFMGVCNVGLHPTIDKLSAPLAETYLLDFSGDVYGKEIALSFVEFLRAERTFDSLEKLQYAIEISTLEARQVLKELL